MLLLGLLVGAVLATRAGAVTSVLATSTALVRWGSPSLTAVAGGQAVLGPAVVVGDVAVAASAWLGAAALVLATPRDRGTDALIVAAVTGVTAGAIAAGPTFVDEPAIRIAGAVVATAAAVAVTRLPFPRAVAVVPGALALVLAATS